MQVFSSTEVSKMAVNESELRTINSALKQVGGDLRAYRDQTEREANEIKLRMQELEQHVAAGNRSGSVMGAGIGSTVSEAVMAEINQGHSAFAHLAAGNIGSATFKVNSTIFAITNDRGASEGSYMPSQPEQGAV